MAITVDIKRSGINAWKAFPADPADFFSEEEIAKAKRYVTPLRRLSMVERTVVFLVDLAIVRGHVAPHVLRSLDVHNWVARLVVTIVLVTVIGTVTGVGWSAYRELSYDKRWGFSTQTVNGFVSDTV
jgi:hypothetical protein